MVVHWFACDFLAGSVVDQAACGCRLQCDGGEDYWQMKEALCSVQCLKIPSVLTVDHLCDRRRVAREDEVVDPSRRQGHLQRESVVPRNGHTVRRARSASLLGEEYLLRGRNLPSIDPKQRQFDGVGIVHTRTHNMPRVGTAVSSPVYHMSKCSVVSRSKSVGLYTMTRPQTVAERFPSTCMIAVITTKLSEGKISTSQTTGGWLEHFRVTR